MTGAPPRRWYSATPYSVMAFLAIHRVREPGAAWAVSAIASASNKKRLSRELLS